MWAILLLGNPTIWKGGAVEARSSASLPPSLALDTTLNSYSEPLTVETPSLPVSSYRTLQGVSCYSVDLGLCCECMPERSCMPSHCRRQGCIVNHMSLYSGSGISIRITGQKDCVCMPTNTEHLQLTSQGPDPWGKGVQLRSEQSRHETQGRDSLWAKESLATEQ